MGLFKKRVKYSEEIEAELKKVKRKERKRLLKLLELYNKGAYLRPGEDLDNKELILKSAA